MPFDATRCGVRDEIIEVVQVVAPQLVDLGVVPTGRGEVARLIEKPE
jgi:hypothetical protein